MSHQRILFVCLGNICRSPTAQAAFQLLINQRKLTAQFTIDSAGTSGEHDGELPHPGTRKEALRHGIELTHISRRVTASDFAKFDLLVAMDGSNLKYLQRLAPDSIARDRVVLFRDYEPGVPTGSDVPDPWYTGEFARVFDICTAASEGLLAALTKR